ncbi:OmpA family protein [Archangium gephyra]|nr:OmpA family protein [Archangium gephyra]
MRRMAGSCCTWWIAGRSACHAIRPRPPPWRTRASAGGGTGAGGARLERLAQALRQRPGVRLTVSGHTCELGTTEYNLALGQRRAGIVRSYLVRLGVEPQRIAVVSYSEERPANEGSVEKNRRAEFSFAL